MFPAMHSHAHLAESDVVSARQHITFLLLVLLVLVAVMGLFIVAQSVEPTLSPMAAGHDASSYVHATVLH